MLTLILTELSPDIIGSAAFGPVKSDLTGNIKVRSRPVPLRDMDSC